MPASLLPMPRARFFNAAGLPLAGGKVFTYVAGTTTPLASFTDYNGTIANTNPVILDSVGEANIWLGNGLYKITLTDANDVVQWTVDNVGQNSVQDLAAGFGIATNIASGATVDLGSIASHFANITGATTITSFGSSASLDAPLYLIKFNGALTLTSSGNLITPTGANITTANNDRAWVEYLGSGAWRVVNYMKADGSPLVVSSNGVLSVPATTSGPSSIVLAEDADNGTHTATIVAPTSMAANRTLTLPDENGTIITTARGASETVQGIVELATNAEASSGTDNTRAITPVSLFGGLNATGAAPIFASRAWVNFNGTGTVAVRGSGNVSSITDNGVGDYTVNFITAMPDINYSIVGFASAGATPGCIVIVSRATTNFRFTTRQSNNPVVGDFDEVHVAVFR